MNRYNFNYFHCLKTLCFYYFFNSVHFVIYLNQFILNLQTTPVTYSTLYTLTVSNNYYYLLLILVHYDKILNIITLYCSQFS